MNDNIKVRKFVLDDKNPHLKLSDQDRTWFLTAVGTILIQIVEIEAENPSDLIIVVTTEGMREKRENPTYLFSYRDNMLFQNNKYIARLDLNIDVREKHFEIEIKSESKQTYKLVAYYSVH